MTPEAIQAVQNISIEAIKILGPAIVTAVVGYKIGKAQLNIRLKEVDKKQEFDARKSFFDLLVKRSQQLNEDYKGLMESFGFLMGASVVGDIDENYNNSMLGIANIHLLSARRTANLTKEHFEKNKITGKDEYKKVIELNKRISSLNPATNFSSLRSNILALMPIYEELASYHDIIIEWELDETLKPYINTIKA